MYVCMYVCIRILLYKAGMLPCPTDCCCTNHNIGCLALNLVRGRSVLRDTCTKQQHMPVCVMSNSHFSEVTAAN
jgi:hypothetical protein